jgi:hypothetical protein
LAIGTPLAAREFLAAVPNGCGCSSGVEHDLAKVGVEGSNPFARSNLRASGATVGKPVSIAKVARRSLGEGGPHRAGAPKAHSATIGKSLHQRATIN